LRHRADKWRSTPVSNDWCIDDEHEPHFPPLYFNHDVGLFDSMDSVGGEFRTGFVTPRRVIPTKYSIRNNLP